MILSKVELMDKLLQMRCNKDLAARFTRRVTADNVRYTGLFDGMIEDAYCGLMSAKCRTKDAILDASIKNRGLMNVQATLNNKAAKRVGLKSITTGSKTADLAGENYSDSWQRVVPDSVEFTIDRRSINGLDEAKKVLQKGHIASTNGSEITFTNVPIKESQEFFRILRQNNA